MKSVEKSFENPRVFSINDEFIVIVGWNNPNDGSGTPASRGTIFIEKTCNSDNATFWIKKEDGDHQSWDTWGIGDTTGSVVVPASQTRTIDTVSLSSYDTVEWLVNINDGGSNSESFKLMARARGTDVEHTLYADVGDDLDYDVDVTSDGSNMEFKVTNDESVSVTVKFRREAI